MSQATPATRPTHRPEYAASAPPLAYAPNVPDTLDRLRQLYDRRAGDRIFARFPLPTRALKRFAARYGEGFCQYPDISERIAFWDEHL